MKLEEIKNKTNEAVSYLMAALESGQSDVLTQLCLIKTSSTCEMNAFEAASES